MNSQKRICKHKKYEEQYLCLEESCLQKSDFKLDCLRCLQDGHSHHECLRHVETILSDAQKNQKKFLECFEQNLQFCQNLKLKLEWDVEEIKQKYSEWIEMQYKTSLQQIEQYELNLNAHKQMFSVSLTSDELKTAVEFNLYDHHQYTQENEALQEILSQNQLEFISYFKVLYDRCFKSYEQQNKQSDELPKIQSSKGISKTMQYEKCTEIGCNNEKKKFCLEQSCLQEYGILECPTCQGMRHYAENKQSHRQHFVSATELWEQQNRRIEELERFCDNKGQEVKNESIELQARIMGYILNNEQKLKKFRQFIVNKESEIQEKLQKFKSQYQKDQLTIYKELFLQQDLSIIAAELVQYSENFQEISNNFKVQCQIEKDICQSVKQDLEDQWYQGFCQFQPKKQNFDPKGNNTIGNYIKKMDEQIFLLTQEKQQYEIQIQQLNKELQNAKKSSQMQNAEILDEMRKIGAVMNQDLQSQITNQNLQLKQAISDVLKQDKNDLKQNINKIQQDNTNLDANVKQLVKKFDALESGVQQIIPQIKTFDEEGKKDLQKQLGDLYLNLTSNFDQKINIVNQNLKQEVKTLNQTLTNNSQILAEEVKKIGQNTLSGVKQEILELDKIFKDLTQQSQDIQQKNVSNEIIKIVDKIIKDQQGLMDEFKTNIQLQLDTKITTKLTQIDSSVISSNTKVSDLLVKLSTLTYQFTNFNIDIPLKLDQIDQSIQKIDQSTQKIDQSTQQNAGQLTIDNEKYVLLRGLPGIVKQQNEEFYLRLETAVNKIAGTIRGERIPEKFETIQKILDKIDQCKISELKEVVIKDQRNQYTIFLIVFVVFGLVFSFIN